MKRGFKGILICLLWVFMAGSVLAQEKTAFIVGVENIEYYPMYAFRDGEYVGYAREVLDAFANDQGYTFEYKPFPLLRLFKKFLEEQTVDFKYPDNQYWQADMRKGKNVYYSEPVVGYVDGVMVLPERKGAGLEKLERLGVVLGFTPWEYLEQIETKKIKQENCSNYLSMLEITLKKRVDGAYSNIDIANYHLENTLKKPGALVFDPDLPYTQSSYLLASIKHPEIIKEFSAWMEENSEFVESLKKSYKVGQEF